MASASQKRPTSAAHKAFTAIGVVLCICFIPILIMNCVLIVRSYTNPDEVPGVGGTFPLIVMSDSMYPVIQKGDLIVCKEADTGKLQVGDVITFYDRVSLDNTVVVTHRITAVEQREDGTLLFTTQGDANDSEDPNKTPAADVIGTYEMRFAGVGNIAMFMQSTPGLVVFVLVPILLLVGYDIVRSRIYDRRRKSDADALLAELEELRAAQGGGGKA